MRRHAVRRKRSLRSRAKYQILLRWPLRFWWKLSPATRDWWVKEYKSREGWYDHDR